MHLIRALLAALALVVPAAAAATPPNVIIILIDDMGWTDWEVMPDLNPTGSIVYETPNLAALAHSGVVFDQGYAASPVCSPSRAALLTGKTTARLHFTDWVTGTGAQTANLHQPNWTTAFPLSETTLAETLHAAGYSTDFIGKWHLGQTNSSKNPLLHGFDTNVGGNDLGSPASFYAGSDGAFDQLPGLDTPGQFPADAYLTDVLTDEAVAKISQRANTGTPFFLMLAHYAVHTPLEAPQDLRDYYWSKILTLKSQGADLKHHEDPKYAGMIDKMDVSVGRVLARLADPNDDGDTSDSIRNDTIVIFTSDNGGFETDNLAPTSNLPLKGAKGSLDEGGIRVPLIVSWTGNPQMPDDSGSQGRLSHERATGDDLYNTVLDLVGLPVDGNLDGASIRGALEQTAFDSGDQYWHYPHISPQDLTSTIVSAGTFVSAVRRGDWKLIYFWDDQSCQLFNLQQDIGESTNLAGTGEPMLGDLLTALVNWLAASGAQHPIQNADLLPAPTPNCLPEPTLGLAGTSVLVAAVALLSRRRRR